MRVPGQSGSWGRRERSILDSWKLLVLEEIVNR